MTTGTDWANVWIKFLDVIFKNIKTALPLWLAIGLGTGAGGMWFAAPSEPVQGEIVVNPTQEPHTHDKHPHPFAHYDHRHADMFNWNNSEIGRLEREIADLKYMIANIHHPHNED